MHIPDGFLDARTIGLSFGLAAIGVTVAASEVRAEEHPKKVPLMGVAGAFIFAAQMINFPIIGGTSGHLVGGVLAATLLGPAAAVIVMTAILTVQCFLFADGGVTALGANIFNMAIISPICGYAFYRFVRRLVPGDIGRIAGATFAAWASTVLASLACAGQLAISGAGDPGIILPAMTGIHMLTGIGEGIMTAMILESIRHLRPGLFEEITSSDTSFPASLSPIHGFTDGWSGMIAFGLIVSLGLAVFVSPFACSWPDGLEHVARVVGFDVKAVPGAFFHAPAPDYRVPGVPWAFAATALAGSFGTIVAFLLSFLWARLLIAGGRRPPVVSAGSTSVS
ncbi:MAG: PDGLE domain-containing protein [Candidatus Riflebacteria bacterium]|nr:PDGLE domain-containing protein [Candidatus Riflebacteria bacterium]